ncbi:MAG: FAD binding domain-containing protein [Ignavibacteriaceae bacterium]|jgi:CO/xanthine dehydrogenase FAD-binding subunit
MLHQNLEWFFPHKVEEAVKLIEQQGVILHGGGTRILKTSPKSIKGLVDVGKLNLNYIHHIDNHFSIGSASTYADVIRYSKKTGKLSMLARALSEAASTPLRNRITIGGSLKDFPIWSSLYAPLLALNAQIEIEDKHDKIISLEEYLETGIIKTKHLIKRIIVDDIPNIIDGVKRFALIRFEYPLFTLAVVIQAKQKTVSEARIFITGVKGRHKHCKRAEHFLIGKDLNDENIQHAEKHFAPKFVSDYKYSAEYKEHTAKVFFTDLLHELKGTLK